MQDIINIQVSEYYGNPYYYSVMPKSIFDALEAASLNDEELATVSRSEFSQMIEDYKLKVEENEKLVAQNYNA